MRIVIIADTHGFLDPRIATDAAGADVLIHAGDVGDGIADALAPLAMRVVIVAGNNDPVDCPWPVSATIDAPGGSIGVMHGHQWPAKTRHRKLCAQFDHARAVICGHSHRRVLATESTPWLLNPGAAGKTRAYGGPSYIELRADERTAWQVEPVVYEPWRLARKPRRVE